MILTKSPPLLCASVALCIKQSGWAAPGIESETVGVSFLVRCGEMHRAAMHVGIDR